MRFFKMLLAVAVFALVLVACGPAEDTGIVAGDDGTGDANEGKANPTTTKQSPATATTERPPAATLSSTTRPVVVDPTPTGARPENADYSEYEIITVLGRDAIPAIDDPQFVSAAEADAELYQSEEEVIGVVFGNEARAYSVPFLSRHEIVNDTVDGVKIAVTW